jgi:hypothetical protein
MPAIGTETSRHVTRWWGWFAVALILLIPLDLFTTLLAVGAYGTVVEANPIMRWLLHQGLVVVTLANLGVVALAVVLFDAAIDHIQRVPPSYQPVLTHAVNVWLGFLIVAGVVLVANNLLVWF